jgi:sterol-4alpha-carboxylate 3-dehydrogenase (decarboxylating)
MESNQDSVLIFGGCGFVGYHIVRHFVKDPTFSSVAVVSRSAANSKNHLYGATYHSGDLTDHDSIKQLLLKIKPTVIIHAASPSPVLGTLEEYQRLTIQGTKNLLKLAKESKNVRAFIYTSSSNVARGPEHLNLTEDCVLANADPQSHTYGRAKALADIMVLEANDPLPSTGIARKEVSWEGHLCTGSLRFPIVYGTHDLVTTPGCLGALQKGQTNVILGDGKNLWDFCSVENAAIAHSLLARALLNLTTSEDTAKVDGEAFNINDGSPRPFWDYARTVWKFAGQNPPRNERVFNLPSWFVMGLASFLEWVFWIFTLGTKRPYHLGKQQAEYLCFTHTYNIEKAKERLGYRPKDHFERGIRESVEWSLEHDGWGKKLKKASV